MEPGGFAVRVKGARAAVWHRAFIGGILIETMVKAVIAGCGKTTQKVFDICCLLVAADGICVITKIRGNDIGKFTLKC
jgi:hypothetical protein